MAVFVPGDPYDFPCDGSLASHNTALVIVDMQKDFLHEEGYFASMGYDVSEMREVIPTIRKVLDFARNKGFFVVHTRQGCRPDLTDLPPAMKWRSKNGGAEIGSRGPLGRLLIRGEKGHDIVDELYPLEGEPVVDKVGSGAFCGTDLELLLRYRGIRNIVFTGITTDVCVHSTIRTAIDTGYDSLLLEDCTAATVRSNYVAALSMIKQEGGYFGSVGSSQAFLGAAM